MKVGYLGSEKDKQPESNDRCRRTTISNDVVGVKFHPHQQLLRQR